MIRNKNHISIYVAIPLSILIDLHHQSLLRDRERDRDIIDNFLIFLKIVARSLLALGSCGRYT